jgi:hypothetical protein
MEDKKDALIRVAAASGDVCKLEKLITNFNEIIIIDCKLNFLHDTNNLYVLKRLLTRPNIRITDNALQLLNNEINCNNDRLNTLQCVFDDNILDNMGGFIGVFGRNITNIFSKKTCWF